MDAKEITIKIQFKLRRGRVTWTGYRLCRALRISFDWKSVLCHPLQFLWLYLGILGAYIKIGED